VAAFGPQRGTAGVTIRLPLADGREAVTRVLVLGCHADDIEIGCGATLLALTRSRPDMEVTWVVLGATGERAQEARASADRFLASAARPEVVVHGFRDGYFPYLGGDVKDVFESLKSTVDPQLVLTHTRFDLHQDHRLVCELTWNTFRDNLILEYEVPKYDGDLGTPNLFVPVSRELVDEKARLLHEGFGTQTGKHWFDEEVFVGLMRIRGMESCSPTGYAEAFTCRKLSLAVN
jgi:LmbE family N-acetylglucosaminyl deacetylase